MKPLTSTHRRLRTVASSLVVLALALQGCGASDESDSVEGEQTSGQEISPDMTDADAIAFARRGAPATQQQFLEDDELTFEEYEQSFFNYVDCLESNDIVVDSTSFSGGQFQLVWRTGAAEQDRLALEETAGECYVQHHEAIQRLWVFLERPSEDEQAEQRAIVAECLQGLGIDVSDAPSAQEITDIALADDQIGIVAGCTPG